MNDASPQNESLARLLARKLIYVWHANADITFYIAITTALIAWGLAYTLGHLGNQVIPFDFKPIRLTDYHQAYDIYENNSVLLLQRARGGLQASLIAFFSFISVFMIANCIPAFRLKPASASSPGRYSRFGAVLAVMMWTVLMYIYVYPSIVIITQPQTLVLDPVHDQALLNNHIVSTMNEISQFEDVETSSIKSESSRFGFTLKDGSYRELMSGVWVGGNLQLITTYLNNYLQTHQLEARASN